MDSPSVLGRRMRLTDWGRQYGLNPKVVWRMLRDGRLPEHLQVERVGGCWYVRVPDCEAVPLRTVLYARVSSSDRANGLAAQSERLQKFAHKQGWALDEVICEIGSGLNGKRRKLLKILESSGGRVRLVVEHRDRLARFGFEMLEACVKGSGGEIVVVEDKELDDDLVRDMTDLLTSMCARLYGKRSAELRARKAVEATNFDGASTETQNGCYNTEEALKHKVDLHADT